MTQVTELLRPSDGSSFYIHFTGGFRAGKLSDDQWRIEPIVIQGKPSAVGPLPLVEVQNLANTSKLQPVALHSMDWMDGTYNSSWVPILPERSNHSPSPSDLWSNIASNMMGKRTNLLFEAEPQPTKEQIVKSLDERAPVEALSRYISMSLRSMDTSVEQIAEYYHEQLVNHISSGRVNGERSDNTLSQTLFAHIHSFFLHLGSARDYLATIISHRIGFNHEKADSMAKLVNGLRSDSLPNDPLLNLLITAGDIASNPEKPGKFTIAGWMKEVTELRNRLVHRRPYGSRFNERFGWVSAASKDAGLYRYFRPIDVVGNGHQDVFDVLSRHYSRFNQLMFAAAKASGDDTSMTHITDKDILSLKVRGGGTS